ncbi:hypothetical protein V6N13_015972 [Hibiscus sabdariffa]
MVKINVDAGFRSLSQEASTGVVIRDCNGNILGASYRVYSPLSSVFTAEALACLHGLLFALDLSFKNVIMESDTRSVIFGILSSTSDSSDIRPFMIDIKHLALRFHECYFRFTPRISNKVAHALANHGFKKNVDLFWIEDAPPEVLALA